MISCLTFPPQKTAKTICQEEKPFFLFLNLLKVRKSQAIWRKKHRIDPLPYRRTKNAPESL
jgi:hypothetical protein